MNEAGERGDDLGLTDDALEANGSVVMVQGTQNLKELACALEKQVRAKLKAIEKRPLRKYGCPSDKQKMVVDRILKPSELFAVGWTT